MTDEQLEELEAKVGTKFQQRALLAQAMVHRSCHFVVNKIIVVQSNEKLEHLGDKVVGLAVCRYLHEKYPEQSENFYSQVLPIAVSNNVLSEVGNSIDLARFLITKDGTQLISTTAVADIMEAIVAALFLDQGLSAVDCFLSQCLYPRIDEIVQTKLTTSHVI